MPNHSDDPVYLENNGTESALDPLETMKIYPPKPLPNEVPSGNPALKFIISVILFVAFYYFFVSKDLQVITWLAVIVFIHELGHYFAMKIFNYEDLSIFFIPLVGAIAGGSKEKISQKEKVIVLLAGPVPGIIIGVISFFIASRLNNYDLLRLSYAFVLINILNLLPIYPLDGGQLLQTLFLGSRQIITTVFMVGSILLLVIYAIVNNEWMLLIIPYFLITRMIQLRQVDKIRQGLDRQDINYSKSFGELTDPEYWNIRDVVVTENRLLARTIIPGEYVVSERENDVINYIKSVLRNQPSKDLSIAGIIIFLLIWIMAIAVPLMIMTRIWLMF